MTGTSNKLETTKRISDEVFAEVERELSTAPAIQPETPKTDDRLNRIAGLALPYVWAAAIGVWAGGILLLRTTMPITQCLFVTLVATSVLSAAVYAWRSLPSRGEVESAR